LIWDGVSEIACDNARLDQELKLKSAFN